MNTITSINTKVSKEQYDKILSQFDTKKILEQSKKQLDDYAIKMAAADRANREPLPENTDIIFNGGSTKVMTSVGMVEVRTQRALDITIFKLTNSPIYKFIMGDLVADLKEMFLDEETLFELIYQFTHDIREVKSLVKTDLKQYRELVLDEVGAKYTPSDIVILTEAILTNIGNANASKVEFDTNNNETDDKKENKKK